jgi:peptidylprolyl isomerase
VKTGSTVTVDYVGVACTTGKTFGSSFGSQPLTISLTSVIPGWQRGIPGMRVGGVRVLGIPSRLGYGAAGTPDGSVGANEPLWFLVKLDKVETPATTTTTAAAATTTTQPAS